MNEYISKEAIIKELEEEIAMGDEFDEKDELINKGLRIALKDIKRQQVADVQPINSLVKIEERVPDVSGNYLCYLATDEFEVLYFDREIEDSEYNFAYPFGVWNTYPSEDGGECREWIEVLEATHWQPLPEPPKEGDTNERS